MASIRHYLVLTIFIASYFTQANCKVEPSESDDDTLYFRENKKTDVAPEININADLEEDGKKNSIFNNTKASHMGPINVGTSNNSFVHAPWWPSFLLNLINRFYHQRIQDRCQFSVLYMARTYFRKDLDNFPLNIYPRNQDGTPVINDQKPLSPPSRLKYVNYVVARPENVPGQSNMKNATLTILDEMNSLLKYYKKRFSKPPNTIVLYSWIMPCEQCTDVIIKYFNKAIFSKVSYKVVAYTTEGTDSNLAYMTLEGNRKSRQRLNENNISYWKQQCERPEDLKQYSVATTSPYDHVCTLSDTFQGCFVRCLGRDFCCSCKESNKASMNVAMVNDLAKVCAIFDIKTCARGWIQKAFSENLSGASPCTNIDSARAKLLSCTDTCVGRPLSKPLDPLNPYSYPGYLVEFSDISSYIPVSVTDFCADIRAEGYLCYNYKANSFTAGNSLCKSGSVCDYHGHEYKWCYTEYGDWYFCCTSECSYGKDNYMSCQVGSNQSKPILCGSPGDIAANGRHCLDGYPCGMHQENGSLSYYWCYTDTKMNWDYCCQPGDTCSKKGENNDWCYTGYKKNTENRTCHG